MNLAAVIIVAWQGVSRRPLRNALSALSLVVGVCAIVLVMSSGAALRDAIELDAILRGGRPATLKIPLSPAPDMNGVILDWRRLLDRSLAPVDHAVALEVQMDTSVRVGGVVDLAVVVTEPSFRSIRPFPLVSGRWLSSSPSLVPELVVNEAAWEQGADLPLPAEVRWTVTEEPARARLVGVVYDAAPAPVVYTRIADSPEWLAASGRTSIHVHVPASGGAALSRAIRNLAERAERQQEIGEVVQTDNLGEVGREINLARRVFLALAGLSLVVGSVSILNIGLATVRERSQELLLRLAFGATRVEVSAIMILESQIVALAAGIVAVPISLALLPGMLKVLGDQYSIDPTLTFPIEAALIGIAASCLAALIGSVAPAVRASRVTIGSATRE